MNEPASHAGVGAAGRAGLAFSLAFFTGLGILSVLPDAAWAHAMVQRYDLPVPLWYYLAGAGLVVARRRAVAQVRRDVLRRLRTLRPFRSAGEGRRAGAPRGAADVASSYVLTLVPIAIAYHLAHYLLLLMIEGQRLYGHISDPFGVGWDLFGTAGMTPDPTVVDARCLWLFSLFVIATGHVIAVWLAHLAARRTAGHGGRAMVAAKLPMLFLMVGYTVFSLWIIGQPIVEV